MYKVFFSILFFVFVCSLNAQTDTQEVPDDVSKQQDTAAKDTRRTVNVSGDAIVTTDGQVTVVPTLIDGELHNRALILRSIGVPLYETGEVLLGISTATWILWAVATLPTLFGGFDSIISMIPGGSALGGVGDAQSAISATLLSASIGLTVSGLLAIISGGVIKSVGNDLRDRSFSTIQ